MNGSHTAEMPQRPTTLQAALWLGVIAAALLMTAANWTLYQPGAHFDDARYIILARSLLGPDQYGMVNAPGAPAVGKYPFGFPLLLAPISALLPQDLAALQIVSLVASLLISALLFWGWRWFNTGTSYWWALGVTALTTLSPMSTGNMRRIMSEPLFTLCCLVAIVLAEQFVKGKRRWWWSTAMALALMFSLYTRTIGGVLVVCVLLYLFHACGRSFWKPAVLIGLQAGLFIALVVALTPVQARDLLPLEYLNDENARFFSSAPASQQAQPPAASEQAAAPLSAPSIDVSRVFSRAGVILQFGIRQHFGSDLRQVAFPLGGGADEARLGERLGIANLPQLTGYFISALVVLGFIRLFRSAGLHLFLLFAATYFASLFLWVWNDPRLLYPIQPQIFLALLAALDGGIKAIARLLRSRLPARAPMSHAPVVAVVAGALLLAISFKSLQGEDSRLHVGDLSLRTQWIKTNTGLHDVIATNAPEIDYLYGERKTVPHPPPSQPGDALAQDLQALQVKYVVLAPEVAWESAYMPVYTEALQALQARMDDLVDAGEATIAFDDKARLLRVYEYFLPAGTDAAARPSTP